MKDSGSGKRGAPCSLCRNLFVCAPGGARFLRAQVPYPSGSGNNKAEGKGVHREVESEGSRMWEIY